MKLRRLVLDKFSVFKNTSFDFCPGLNVIIGPNGTGKSHLLKLLYAALKAKEASGNSAPDSPEGLKVLLPQKIARVFKPDESALNRLITRRKRQRDTMKVELQSADGSLEFSINANGKLTVGKDTLGTVPGTIFLPSREVLALYEGFIAAYEKRELSFDETFRDLCVALQSDALRGPRNAVISALAEPFEKDVLQGTVRLDGGRFEVYNDDGVIEAHLLSEGQRKIASLVRLIVNGALTKNALLFWDEPEANLNPRLVTRVAGALRSLAAGGVQIFISTHDYLLTQELSLAAEYPERSSKLRCDIRFFCLERDVAQGGIKAHWADTLAALPSNPILDEFAAHYDREQQAASGASSVRE